MHDEIRRSVMSAITELDFSILDALQKIHTPVLNVILMVFTYLGDAGAVWILMSIIFLCIKKLRGLGGTMATALILELLVSECIIKNLVARERPFNVRSWIEVYPYVIKPGSYSFPSGHTCCSFAAATVIFCYNKKAGIAAYAVAAVIGFSRNYFYLHYPTDVLCGAVEGVLLGLIAVFITKKIKALRTEKTPANPSEEQ